MYAVIRAVTLRAGDQAGYADAHKEFATLRAQQPGYRGTISVDAGDGRRMAIAFWESDEVAAAASSILAPHAERLLGPHWAVPATIVHQGPVVEDDLTTR
jgi:heme-degrading monooxygenase HmoA